MRKTLLITAVALATTFTAQMASAKHKSSNTSSAKKHHKNKKGMKKAAAVLPDAPAMA